MVLAAPGSLHSTRGKLYPLPRFGPPLRRDRSLRPHRLFHSRQISDGAELFRTAARREGRDQQTYHWRLDRRSVVRPRSPWPHRCAGIHAGDLDRCRSRLFPRFSTPRNVWQPIRAFVARAAPSRRRVQVAAHWLSRDGRALVNALPAVSVRRIRSSHTSSRTTGPDSGVE